MALLGVQLSELVNTTVKFGFHPNGELLTGSVPINFSFHPRLCAD
jgi:hypothetical protein